MSQRTIMLIRHGQYDQTVTEPVGGNLTALGRQQAHFAGEALSHLPVNTIYYSTMNRAQETAEIISGFFPAKTNMIGLESLWESVPHVPDSLTDFFVSKGTILESVAENRQTLDTFFDEHFVGAEGEPVCDLVVCHGNVIRYFVSRVLDVSPDVWLHMGVYHCGITEVQLEPDFWKEHIGDPTGIKMLISFNGIQHIPPELRTRP